MTKSHYQLGKVIGAGAMGDVLKAVDTRSDAAVAMKRLKGDLVMRDPAVLQRFIREGEALRQLDHPNIVKVLDTFSDGKAHYIVMEYIEGGDLHQYLSENAPLPVEDALKIAIQLADALTRSHFLGIIHRDIKPANILMAGKRTPKLTDFGIAHFAEAQDGPTQTGMVVGTYAYLSPEACMGMPLDARSDIWAFGVVLYEMLTGRRPFMAQSPGKLVIEIMNTPFADPQELNPAIPDDLNDLLYRILTKQREARIPTIRLVGAEIEALLGGFDLPPTGSSTAPPPAATEALFVTSTEAKTTLHNLPHQPTPFVGRRTELAELQRLIDDADVRLVTVHGPGGMGKSRLAIEAAHTRLGAFPDGVYFVELAPLTDHATIPAAIAEAAHFRFEGSAPPTEQIMTFLANKEMLLILDNFEHIMAGSEVVADILKAAPNVMVVVTSRERLKLTGETVFTLGGMDFPAWETPADALRYSAVQLFMQAATRARFDFELHDDNLDHLARICRLVQGTPLGIILAAGWVDTLPLEEIAAEMEDSIDFLETELTDLPERQRSIRAAFEYSWRLLTAEERHTFSQLSVFRGSCTHRAAKRVTGAGLRMLTRLANKSLLGRNPTTGRFELHELLRQIGAEHIDEALPLQQAHAEYYLDALATLTPELKGKAQVSALENISYDFENVRIAWLWALNRGRADLLLNAMEALALYCEMRNRLTDGYSLLQGVIDADLTPHLTARATLHHDLMDALGKPFPEEKAQAYTAALTLAADVDDPLLRLQALTGQASVHLANLRYSETLPLLQQALALTEDSYWVAVIHQRIGFIYTQLQQLPEAIDHTQRSYDLRKALGDTFGLSKSANNLGALAGLSGDSEAAQAYTHEAMTYAKQVGDLVSYGFAAANLASGFVIMGNVEEARQLAEEIITICERINSAARLAGAYYCRMNVALAEAAYDQALAYRDRVHTLGTSDIQVRAPTMIQTIIAHMGLGDFAAAKDVLRRLTSVMPEGNRSLRAYCLRIMAPMLLHQGEAAAAVTALARAHTPTEGYSPQLEPYPLFEPLPARLKEALGQEAFEQAWQRGTERGIFDLYEEMTAKVLVGS